MMTAGQDPVERPRCYLNSYAHSQEEHQPLRLSHTRPEAVPKEPRQQERECDCHPDDEQSCST